MARVLSKVGASGRFFLFSGGENKKPWRSKGSDVTVSSIRRELNPQLSVQLCKFGI